MFKSIQYRLYVYTALLVLVVAGLTYSIADNQYILAVLLLVCFVLCLSGLINSYKRYNQNFLFLLNALENGDYSFNFSETKLSVREKEMNKMMNRIKELLIGAKTEVIENEKYLSIIIENVPTGIFIMDDRGIIHTVNNAALKILGLPLLTHVNQLRAVDEKLPASIKELRKEDTLDLNWNNEKEKVSINVKASEIMLKRGMMRVITLNNISSELESKEMDSWIRLIRVMTHEIMNSIAPITSLSETMLSVFQSEDILEDNLKQNSAEAFQTIHSTATSLLSFVESYRKFTAIPQPTKRPVVVSELISKIVKLEEIPLQEKGINLIVDIKDDTLTVNADEKLITQVIINLIKNAIEAVEAQDERTIILRSDKEEQHIRIEVANNGTPIPEDILPHIFIPFFTTKTQGSGIGLSISRQIMRLHEGKLQHSTAPDGTTSFSMLFIH